MTDARDDSGDGSGVDTGGEASESAERPGDAEEGEAGGRGYAPVAGMAGLFLATVLVGLVLAGPFREAGLQQFEDPSSAGNAGLIIAEILVFTVLFLLALRYARGVQLIRGLVLVAFAMMFHYPVRLLLPEGTPLIVAVAVGLAGAVVLWRYPEWYVIDVAAVIGGGVIIALFGVSLSTLPVLLLLAALAVYDAYSVYVSEHMQSVAGGVLDLKVPMVFVVPATPEFSMREVEDLDDAAEKAMFLGVGDAAIPGLLAVSADTYLDAPAVLAGLNAPALGAAVGAVVGLLVLFVLMFRVRRAHAGLPALNGCVIGGYLVGAFAAGISPLAALGL